MSSHVVAIDLGKTGCRGSLRVDGREIRFAEAPGAPGLADAGGVEAAEYAIGRVIEQISPKSAFTLSIGAAGAASAPDAAAQLAHRVADLAAAVAVTSDAVTAHAGALGGSPGVVLAIGTGAVATAVDTAGRFTRVDGWGPQLGDEGGGAWIGLAGLRAVLRAHDGRGARSNLSAKVTEVYGVDPDALPQYLGRQDNPAMVAARFAPFVAAAAADDAIAAAIMTAAGQALAHTVFAAIERSGMVTPVPFAVTGGLTGLGAVLLDPLDGAIAHAIDRRAARGDPIDGAALLALDTSTALEAWITRISDNY